VPKKTTAIRHARIAAALAAVLAGCVAYAPEVQPMAMPWGQRVVVSCMGDKTMAIDFVPSPRAARVTFDGTTVTLPPGRRGERREVHRRPLHPLHQ
jgi:hypothetical protein